MPSAPGKLPKRLSKVWFSIMISITCLIGVLAVLAASADPADLADGCVAWAAAGPATAASAAAAAAASSHAAVLARRGPPAAAAGGNDPCMMRPPGVGRDDARLLGSGLLPILDIGVLFQGASNLREN